MRFGNLLAKLLFLDRQLLGSIAPSPVAAAMNAKQKTQPIHRVAPLEPLNYRKLFSESDIKSAVAFFRISFSISIWRIFFSSSWILR